VQALSAEHLMSVLTTRFGATLIRLGRMTLAQEEHADALARRLLVFALRAPWVASRSAGLWGGRVSAFNI
jgi:hypothetical protein